jgi:hypothetical protein
LKRSRLLLSVAILVGLTLLTLVAIQGRGGIGLPHERRLVLVGLYENAPKVYTDAKGRPAGLFVDAE